MTLDQLRTLVAGSTANDWHRIVKAGPTYRDRFGAWSGPTGSSGLEHDTHDEVAVYRHDVDLTLAYGLAESQHDRDLTFSWSSGFPDSTVQQISIVDLFWRGSLVDRCNYVYVDGARAVLPLGGGNDGLKITRQELAVARLLSDIAGHREFDRYYASVPFELQD